MSSPIPSGTSDLRQNFLQIRVVRHHDARKLERIILGGGHSRIHDRARRVACGLRMLSDGLVLTGRRIGNVIHASACERLERLPTLGELLIEALEIQQ